MEQVNIALSKLLEEGKLYNEVKHNNKLRSYMKYMTEQTNEQYLIYEYAGKLYYVSQSKKHIVKTTRIPRHVTSKHGADTGFTDHAVARFSERHVIDRLSKELPSSEEIQRRGFRPFDFSKKSKLYKYLVKIEERHNNSCDIYVYEYMLYLLSKKNGLIVTTYPVPQKFRCGIYN